LGYELAGTAFLLLRGTKLTVFDEFSTLVEDLPDNVAETVGDRPDGLQVAKTG